MFLLFLLIICRILLVTCCDTSASDAPSIIKRSTSMRATFFCRHDARSDFGRGSAKLLELNVVLLEIYLSVCSACHQRRSRERWVS